MKGTYYCGRCSNFWDGSELVDGNSCPTPKCGGTLVKHSHKSKNELWPNGKQSTTSRLSVAAFGTLGATAKDLVARR